MESARKHWEIKLVTTKKEETICFEPNYHTTKFFSKTLLVMQMKKTHIFMVNPVYLVLSILEISKILMYEFWYVM